MSPQRHRIVQPDDGWVGLVISALLIKAGEGKKGKRWHGWMVGSPQVSFSSLTRELFYETQEMTEGCWEEPWCPEWRQLRIVSPPAIMSQTRKKQGACFWSHIEDRRKSSGALCWVREQDWAVAPGEHSNISPAELQWGAGMFPINRLQIQSCGSSSL